MSSSPSASIGAVEFLPRLDFSEKDIASFDCGTPQLNQWLKQYSRGSAKKGLTTAIMVEKGKHLPILGYATVCASTVEKALLPEARQSGLGSYPVSVFLIARFAVSKDHQGQGLGRRQLMHIFKNTYQAISTGLIGARGIIVDAKDQGAVDFYQKFDLELFADQTTFPKRMFIAYETIQDSLLP